MSDVNVIQTKVVRVGNSKGIVIPKKMLDFLTDTVQLKRDKNTIIIEPVRDKVIPQEEWDRILSVKKKEYDDKEFADFDITSNDGWE